MKKGRYSLDRRAEAILESRHYWKSNVTSPSLKSSGSSSRGSPRVRPESGNGTPASILSPSVSDSLSTDDFFTMLGEVCGDELAKASSGIPISTTDNTSISTLLSTSDNAQLNLTVENINTNPVPLHAEPVSQSDTTGNNSSPLGQFTFTRGSTKSQGQIPYPNAINTSLTLLLESEIKQEISPQQCSSVYRLPPPNQNPVAPHYVNEGLPRFTTGASATPDLFGFHMSGASNYPASQSGSLHHSPPIQCV